MLLDGFNHVGLLTADLDRFEAFYTEVFGATVLARPDGPPNGQMSILLVGPHSELNVFQLEGNEEAQKQVPMFGRGRLDHLALHAASLEDFETIRDRLIERGASDGFVTDFGPILSLFYRDPDGLESELCIENPDAIPGVMNPPGTPAKRYHPDG